MGKYKEHAEFGANAPINWRERTTSEAYLAGMSGIAPPGMKPKVQRGKQFEAKTEAHASAKWHRNYDLAMFGGTDVAQPGSEAKQQALEGLINNGIPRVPQMRREE